LNFNTTLIFSKKKLSTSKIGRIEGGSIELITKAICRKAFKIVRGPEQQQVGLVRSGMGFQELSKLKLQVTLESNLLN
jgi:hypothetical protein